jgi:hypothetical protein
MSQESYQGTLTTTIENKIVTLQLVILQAILSCWLAKCK